MDEVMRRAAYAAAVQRYKETGSNEDHEAMLVEFAKLERGEYLARIGAKGGAKSRRKLTKKEARRIALFRWGRGEKAAKQSGTGSATDRLSDL